MIFSLSNAQKFPRDGFTAYVYNNKDQCSAMETVYVDCFKDHEKVYVKNCHRLYFVIEGAGTFTINDKTSQVKQNDVIIIEPMVPYSYQGKMKLFEVNSPATGEGDEVLV